MRIVLIFAGAALVLLALFGHGGADTIALEARVRGSIPSDPTLLSPFFDELALHGGRRWDGDLVSRFEERSSLPGRTTAGLRDDFVVAVDKEYRLWTSGQFRECVPALQRLVDEAHSNPVDVSANPRIGSALFKALVGLSLCHHRLGDEESSRAALSELLRSFDLEVTKAQFGVEASSLFTHARSEQGAAATGALTVRSSDDVAAVFINERFVKVGQVSRAGLAPGRYRVFAQLGQRHGRVSLVEIKSGESSTVNLDPTFEQAIVTASDWSGLLFADREERAKREAGYAARVGAAILASNVVVVGVDKKAGSPVLYGIALDVAKGTELRRAHIPLDNAAGISTAMRSLARYLMGAPREAGIEVEGTRSSSSFVSSSYSIRPRDHETEWRWGFTGAAVVSAGAGAALLVLDGDCTTAPSLNMKCPDLRDYRLAGLVLAGAGVALGGVATWLWLSDDSRRPRKTSLRVAPSRDGGTAWVTVPW